MSRRELDVLVVAAAIRMLVLDPHIGELNSIADDRQSL
jgi:hypothetical protein